MTTGDPRLLTVTTVQQLADYLDVPEKRLRAWLRQEYPTKAPGQGDQWVLTPEMKKRMAERVYGRR
jgi:phage antirepressor YoqD-like protein